MSPPDSTSPVKTAAYSPKAKSDIYTVMLIIAFVALLLGCILLALELTSYNWDVKAGQARVAALSAPPSAAANLWA